jgi:SecD/SecF fusion protein
VLSGLGDTLEQHFAVALDNRLLTVPSIDFRIYPQGIPGSGGADIVAGFTPSSARDLAILLRYGPLAVSLQPR